MSTTKPPPVERVLYRPACLQDGPDNNAKSPKQRPSDYSSILMIRRVTGEGRRKRVKHDAIEFVGNTRDEVNEKQAEWIGANGAIEDQSEE